MDYLRDQVKKMRKNIGIWIQAILVAVIKNAILVPALLITIGLELLCIAQYFIDDKSKKKTVYGLFIFGVALVLFAVIYTIVKVV